MYEPLKGAVDLHIHAGPSVMPRAVDAAEMLKEAEKYGYEAFVIKDHYFPTMMSAQIVEKHLSKGTKVYGGIALNNSVGGLNVKALDAACAMDAKIVWMPTVSTLNHIEKHEKGGLKFPKGKGMLVKEKPIVYVDDRGELNTQAKEVLSYIAQVPDLILATGHGSAAEVDAAVREAYRLGIRNILVNHPHYMIGATLEQMENWADMGAMIELNATVFVPDSIFGVNKLEEALAILERIGTSRIVLDSDYGQNGNGSPAEGMLKFISLLQTEGKITNEQIDQMLKHNSKQLLGGNAL